VFRFVPAQIVSREFKYSLMFKPPDRHVEDELFKLGYDLPVGATMTGMADSFQEFGWLGCIFFACLGWLFRSLYQATKPPNAMFAQLFYILIGTSAMRAVTHQTIDFLPGMTYYIIFLGLLFLYVRLPTSRARKMQPRVPGRGGP